jgi:hypothetical protein
MSTSKAASKTGSKASSRASSRNSVDALSATDVNLDASVSTAISNNEPILNRPSVPERLAESEKSFSTEDTASKSKDSVIHSKRRRYEFELRRSVTRFCRRQSITNSEIDIGTD